MSRIRIYPDRCLTNAEKQARHRAKVKDNYVMIRRDLLGPTAQVLLDLLVRTDTNLGSVGGSRGGYPMGCRSPQLNFVREFDGSFSFSDCGICDGCVRAHAKTVRERQMEWYKRMKGRNAHV